MTDFFALLEQPRQPWLDPDGLKQKFHQLARARHPDVRSENSGAPFENINQAYRVLLDPKLRIQHLFALENIPLPTERTVPADLQELFLKIGTLSQKSRELLTELGRATDALRRSLLLRNLLPLRSETTVLLQQVSELYEDCLAELCKLNTLWKTNRAEAIDSLQILLDRIAYLPRWLAQLRETQFQLALR